LIFIAIAYHPTPPVLVGFIQHVPVMRGKAFLIWDYLGVATLPLNGYLSVTLFIPVATIPYLQLKIRIFENGQ